MKITGTCSRYQYQRMLVGKLFVNGIEVTPGGGSGSIAWGDITDKPLTFLPMIGTTSTTAAAGNHTHDAATTSKLGFVKVAAKQSDSTATDVEGLLADFNALLAKFRAAGLLSST